MRMTLSFILATSLWACAADEATPKDVNVTGGVATEGGGNPYDQLNPNEAPPTTDKADGFRYEIPALPTLSDPQIIVSLEGLTVELIDVETGFYKVYPTGVGAKDSQGVSFTPVGEFTTGPDPDDTWWYYPRRYTPEYFGGFPFLRLTATNHKGYNTYGLHGPITSELIRGFVSHGCMRMRGEDIVEIFYMVKGHPSTPVRVQTEARYTPEGDIVDVTPPDQDPVALYQASLNACEDDAYDDDATLEAGLYELQLCDEADRFWVETRAGDRLTVKASAEAEIALHVYSGEDEVQGEQDEDGAWVAELRAAEDGQAQILISGAQTSVILSVALEPFTPVTPSDDEEPGEAP
ncbi:L,D-transpeptidase [Myxococcota bacterium]|nr:L,D-transpeptidase [Myxococcota bacterium]MBU1430110.1 L,D-transpeptidase [Myxococcota bacterium]MBU1896832.1 L,D-transpeptidase [Myxococcota bacterium]